MADADLMESAKRYAFNMRFTTNEARTVKAYTDKNSFEIKKSISFDIENRDITSLEYFVGSIVSSILLAISGAFKKRDVEVEELEAKATVTMENPLTLVGVRGYDEPPIISSIGVRLFICADLEKPEVEQLCQTAIGQSLVVNSVKHCIAIPIEYRIEEY